MNQNCEMSEDEKWNELSKVGVLEAFTEKTFLKFNQLEVGVKYRIINLKEVRTKWDPFQKSVLLESEDFLIYLPNRFSYCNLPKIEENAARYFAVVEMVTVMGQESPNIKFFKGNSNVV